MDISARCRCKAAFLVLLQLSGTFTSSAQTQIDLSSQSRNVDFSAARSVVPFPTGTVLPAACTPGAFFFKTDAKSGSNVYGCTSQDVWTMQGAGNTVPLTWGNITGTLANQADLNTALSGKADTNLTNLANPSTARTNLGLGSAATQPSSAFAGSSHQHAATDITTGFIPPARLGSGTANSTTVLYGDNVFRTPPAGTGSTPPVWGNITGTLASQTDLNTALSGKADTSLGNLSSPATARTNLGLGSAATQPSSAFAGSSHQHPASDISSGVLPAARLGTGTADGTTVLFGDNVFRTLPSGGSGNGPAGPLAAQSGQTVNITCGASCYVNGYSFSNLAATISGFPSVTRTDYVYTQGGVVKYGYSSGSAPSGLTAITAVSGISAMPTGPDVTPLAVVTLSNGSVLSVADARNAAVGQPDVVVAGAGLTGTRSGSTLTVANALINGVNLVAGTATTLTAANLYQLIRCNNAAGCTITVPQAGTSTGFVNGTYFWVKNDSTAGTVTIAPTGSTIDAAATYTLSPGQSVQVWSDSSKYLVTPGKSVNTGDGATAGGTNGQIQYNNSGSLAGISTDAANGVPLLDGAAKLKTAQFPGSIPSNAATASALASAPTTCPTGQSPTGILANGNATGCAPNASMPSGTPNQILATNPSGSTSATVVLRSLVPNDIPVLPPSKQQLFDPTDFSMWTVNDQFDGNTFSNSSDRITPWLMGGNGCYAVQTRNPGTFGEATLATNGNPNDLCVFSRNSPNSDSIYRGLLPPFTGNSRFAYLNLGFLVRTPSSTFATQPMAMEVGFVDNPWVGGLTTPVNTTWNVKFRVITNSTTTCSTTLNTSGATLTGPVAANRWHVVVSNDGSTSTCIDTGIDAAENTNYKFRFEAVPGTGTVNFYMAAGSGSNFSQVGSLVNHGRMPAGWSGGLFPYTAVQSLAANGVNAYLSGFKGYATGLGR
jgi:hypothetical protein